MPRDSKPPAFMFYPDDFSSDEKVEAMCTEAVGCYILLLCKAWRSSPPGTLPNDDRLLACFARVTEQRWAGLRHEVLEPFCLGSDGRLTQRRLRREYEKQRERSKERADSGRKGADKRWHSYSSANGKSIATESESENESTELDQPSKKKAKRGRANAPPSAEIPASLNAPEFAAAWADWEKHRTEIGKRLTPTAVKQQFDRLGKMGIPRAVAAIRHSIGQGWTGIYEEASHGKPATNRVGPGQSYDPSTAGRDETF